MNGFNLFPKLTVKWLRWSSLCRKHWDEAWEIWRFEVSTYRLALISFCATPTEKSDEISYQADPHLRVSKWNIQRQQEEGKKDENQRLFTHPLRLINIKVFQWIGDEGKDVKMVVLGRTVKYVHSLL